MARKKTEQAAMPITETQPDLRAVRLYLPKEHHKLLRKLAADQETNMALLARKIVMEYVATHAGKVGGK
jgi:hypothetical protein